MKKIIYILSLLSIAKIPLAISNTMQFVGEVSTQTCAIKINGQEDAAVLMPTVSLKELARPGDFAGETQINITVTRCQPLTKTGFIKVIFRSDAISLWGDLLNVLNPTGGVFIQLRDYRYSAIALTSEGVTLKIPIGQGETIASTIIRAYYVSEEESEGASAGPVQASAQFAISYD